MNFISMTNNQILRLIKDASTELENRFTANAVRTAISEAPIPKTLHETRKEKIEEAKDYLVSLKSKVRPDHFLTSKDMLVNAFFTVNRKKRTVTCIVKGFITKRELGRGTAKCNTDDTFNIHIGKAIALHRALGFPVPQSLNNIPNAVEVEVGDIIGFKNDESLKDTTYRVDKLYGKENLTILTCDTEDLVGEKANCWNEFNWAKILDDSKL